MSESIILQQRQCVDFFFSWTQKKKKNIMNLFCKWPEKKMPLNINSWIKNFFWGSSKKKKVKRKWIQWNIRFSISTKQIHVFFFFVFYFKLLLHSFCYNFNFRHFMAGVVFESLAEQSVCFFLLLLFQWYCCLFFFRSLSTSPLIYFSFRLGWCSTKYKEDNL